MDGPIGRVIYGNGAIVATLVGVDKWEVTVGNVPDESLARGLATYYADAYDGPHDGHYGQSILRDLAARTGGTMWMRDFAPAGPGAVN